MNQTLYFSSISFNGYHNDIWNNIYDSCDYDGKFFMNIGKRLNPNRFVTRHGEWSLPWKQELMPGFEMPELTVFNKTFSEVTDNKALDIKRLINNGQKFVVMYSGGIDSTVIMAALLKNLSDKELASISVSCSSDSIIENPTFFKKYIQNKFTILDSNIHKYDDLYELGYKIITADEGDCIFGTVFGLTLYTNYEYYLQGLSTETQQNLMKYKHRISDETVHYSTYKDLIIKHLQLPEDPEFGRILYEKYDHNVKTSTVPVNSLHDFFWWLIFNVKYLNCSIRGALYFNDRVEYKKMIENVVNWYNDSEYQQWSMNNNNNGTKIHKSMSSYKTVAKDYIYEFDKNPWYRDYKIKLESMWVIAHQQKVTHLTKSTRPVERVGLTKDYKMMYINDSETQEFYKYHLQNYTIEWTHK